MVAKKLDAQTRAARDALDKSAAAEAALQVSKLHNRVAREIIGKPGIALFETHADKSADELARVALVLTSKPDLEAVFKRLVDWYRE